MCSRCASSTPPLPTMYNSQTVVRLGTHEREATFSCLSISRKTVQLALAHTLCLPPSTDLPKSLPVQSRSTVTRSSPVQFVAPYHSLLSISHPTAKTVSCSSCFSILRYAPFCFSYPVIQTEPDSLSLVAMHQLEPSSSIHLICARELPHIFKAHQLLLSPASSSLRLPRIRESAHAHSEQCVRSCSICAHTHLRGGVRKGIVSLC